LSDCWVKKIQNPNKLNALNCISHIIGHFPEISKLQKFLKKFDSLISDLENQKIKAVSRYCTFELKKQMKLNKVLMKIFVDIRLKLAQLQGPTRKTLKDVKFAIKLHKSIEKFENKDFTQALLTFPSMTRFDILNQNGIAQFGLRKIIDTLIH
jgi:hypothetical protein